MSTESVQLSADKREQLVAMGWELDSPHQPVPIEQMPDVSERQLERDDRMAMELTDNKNNWIAAEADKRLLDVRR